MKLSIHEACRGGDLDAVRVLTTADPSAVNADDERRWRPVFYAAAARHAGIVRFLLQAGADVAAHRGRVLRCVGGAASSRDIVALLITHGALEAHVRPADDLSRQFLTAVFLGDEFRVRALLRLYPALAEAVDGRGQHPLHHAARRGDTAIVRALLSAGAAVGPVSPRGEAPLHAAGRHGHAQTVRLLLERGADAEAWCSPGGQTLHAWLGQFPDQPKLIEVARVLQEHASARGGSVKSR